MATLQRRTHCSSVEAWSPPTRREPEPKDAREEPRGRPPPRPLHDVSQWRSCCCCCEEGHPQPVRQPPSELLVRFGNRTHVFEVFSPQAAPSVTTERILSFVSNITGWPASDLRVYSLTPPFCTVTSASRLRGGKGGFGTLLKGQSRQAANRTTTDFSACRDLQGRRLRTVNDEIAQRLHREWAQKVESGQATREDMIRALADTPSGVAGWFLQLPAWAEKGARKVARRQHQKQMAHWKREQREQQQREQDKRQLQEQLVSRYLTSTQEKLSQVASHLQSAIQQGLQAAERQASQERHRKRKLEEAGPADPAQETQLTPEERKSSASGDDAHAAVVDDAPDDANHEKPSPLVTLSGEVVRVLENPNNLGPATRLQGASNFATVGVLLERAPSEQQNLYYEVVVVSGGLVQIGWVAAGSEESAGSLNSEAGDGVGDVPGSWSYDGSRQIKLHVAACQGPEDATTVSYGPQWKAGDVVGSLYRDGSIRYFVNGRDAGVAFETIDVPGPELIPAVSFNAGEVIEVRLNRSEFQYFDANASGAAPVGDAVLGQTLLTTVKVGDDGVTAASSPQGKTKPQHSADTPTSPADGTPEATRPNEPSEKEAPPTELTKLASIKPTEKDAEALGSINLDEFDSAGALEALGLDHLKAALVERGLKCGGSLRERAARLFSVRGLAPDDYPKKLLAKK